MTCENLISLVLRVDFQRERTRWLWVVCVLLSALQVMAYDFEKDGLCYDINSATETVSVTYKSPFGGSYSGEIVVPSSVEHEGVAYSVTGVGERAFFRCTDLQTIEIPESVQRIGNYAFYLCLDLTSVTMGDGVKSIGRSAFHDCCSLRLITLSKNLTSVGVSAFQGCSSLTEILLPDGVRSLGDGLFFSCSALTSLVVPDGAVRLDWYVFRFCENLQSLHIGSGVKSVGEGLIWDCPSLKSVVVDDDNPVFDSRDGCNAVIETATNTLVFGCRSTRIPASVTDIGQRSFYGCSELTSLTIPEGVKHIWREAFCGSGLRRIAFPETIKSVGKQAFSHCYNLSDITLSSSVESIESCAFSFCRNLSSVTCMAETVPTTASDAFYGLDLSAATLYVPVASLNRYRALSPWSEFGTILPIDPSDLWQVTTEEEDAEMPLYDLSGRRLSHRPGSGFYIRDGKKYRVK